MFYTIYKTTNIINGKFYIGKHQTKDLNDGYAGSGKRLRYAMEKYGKDNFHTEILHVCETEKEMNTLERILVVPDPEISYNLCRGGNGGFSYINANRLWQTDKHAEAAKRNAVLAAKASQEKSESDPVWRQSTNEKISEGVQKAYDNGFQNGFKDKQHSIETKRKISINSAVKQKGQLNSQYGTCWITNGVENKKIKKEDLDLWLQLGYKKGRIVALSPNS